MTNKKLITFLTVVITALTVLYFNESRINSSNYSDYELLAVADHEKLTSGSYKFEQLQDNNTITTFKRSVELINSNNSQTIALMNPAISAIAIAKFLNGNLPTTTPSGNNGIPTLLSQTGAFSNLTTLIPSPGLIPYDMIEPFWSDGAAKKRWMAIPNDGSYDTADEQITFSNDDAWDFPQGSVLIKHFEIGGQRLETRFEVKGDDDVYYYLTYKWNNAQTDATLLNAAVDEDVVVNGQTQSWHYPSRNECASCHFPQNGSVLGPKTRHLNKAILYPSSGITMNQLVNFSELGLITETITSGNVSTYSAVAAKNDLSASIEDRARSYIDVNCASCHNPTVDNIAMFDARYTTPIENQNIIYGDIVYDQGLSNPKVIIPQDVLNSMAHFRMNSTQNGVEMPPIAKDVVDTAGVQLIEDWINSLTPTTSSPPVALFTASTVNGPAPLSVDFDASASTDADGDTLSYFWDFGDGTTASGITASHVFTSSAEFTVTLTVNDGLQSDQATTLIAVNNSNPGENTVAFTDNTDLFLGQDNYSGVTMGVIDMNGDGKDDIVQFNNARELRIQYQNGIGEQFTSFNHGSVSSNKQWGTAIADFDHNGYNDVMSGGYYDNLKIIKNNNGNNSYSQSNIPNSSLFLQGVNFADINNDGWADIFACHDHAESKAFENNQDGTFSFDANLISTETTPISDNSGNYASMWMDYDNDGDLDLYISKCRGGVSDPNDPKRINMLWQNDGNNNYTEVAAQANLKIGAQSWLSDFGDIDNDGDLDAIIINHYEDPNLMRNNGDGTFTEITAGSGLLPFLSASNIYGIQGFFKDFNNDGFVDLMVSGIGNHFIFYNNGDGTFQNAPNPFNSNKIHSFSVGDINHDGFLDIYAGYATGFNNPSSIKDKVWLNDGNTNNFLNIQLKGTDSNINGIGARVEVYGTWGKQIRDVRSGEGYGLVNTFTQHFGIGVSTKVEKVVVRWPSGNVDEIWNPSINEFLVITESEVKTYTYNNGWSPSDPNNGSNSNGEIIIEAGEAVISKHTIADIITVDPDAALTVNTGITLKANETILNSTSQLYSSLISNGTVEGIVKYERYVNANTGGNDLISPPLSGQTWTDFLLSGTNATDILNDGNDNPRTYLFGHFDKTTTDWFVNYTDETTTTLNSGIGYRAATVGGTTLTFTGTTLTTPVTVDIINSGSAYPDWNLIGNPYPSYISIADFLNYQTAPTVKNIDILEDISGIYGYDGNGSNGWDVITLANAGDRLMAPGQGFFVAADAAHVNDYDITFDTSMRAIGSDDDFIAGRSADILTFLKLNASTANNDYRTEFYFNDNATQGLDLGYDGKILGNTAPSFAFYSHLVEDNTGLPIALQALNPSDLVNTIIPLGVNSNQGEQITFSISESTLPSNAEVYLEDNVANTVTLLNSSDYTFTPNVELNGTGRFYLRISSSVLSAGNNELDYIHIYTTINPKSLIIKGELSTPSEVNLYDIQGRLVLNKPISHLNLINTVDISMMGSGVYFATVVNDNQSKTQKIIIN
ncbi:FG-GAP-like repeat-containing protein [uncultured Winogradskyella sp.]|uniref:FG-GAP-like repeat-containing protein n=1 Tax=uncultured Winogradskyella sp. TaxID=395353 RepID=UPI0026221ED7|nr:FG-GAP-like repeat-containing protein [uncultured Winogradskyella sp.]